MKKILLILAILAIASNGYSMNDSELKRKIELKLMFGTGDIEKIKKTISKNNVNKLITKVDTPLTYAAYSGQVKGKKTIRGGNTDVVEYLITLGADVNKRNKDGETPLQIAAYFENANIVKYLLEKGADANTAQKALDEILNIWKNISDQQAKVRLRLKPSSIPTIEYLVEYGATIPDKKEMEKLHETVQKSIKKAREKWIVKKMSKKMRKKGKEYYDTEIIIEEKE